MTADLRKLYYNILLHEALTIMVGAFLMTTVLMMFESIFMIF